MSMIRCWFSLTQVHCHLDVTQATLGENVKLEETVVFGGVHVKVSNGKALRHHLQGRMPSQGFFGDQDTSGVHG